MLQLLVPPSLRRLSEPRLGCLYLGLEDVVAGRCRSVVFPGGRSGLGLAVKAGLGPLPAFLELLLKESELPDLVTFYGHAHAHHDRERLLTRPGEPKP